MAIAKWPEGATSRYPKRHAEIAASQESSRSGARASGWAQGRPGTRRRAQRRGKTAHCAKSGARALGKAEALISSSVKARPHDVAAEAEPFGAARQRFAAIIQGGDGLFQAVSTGPPRPYRRAAGAAGLLTPLWRCGNCLERDVSLWLMDRE